MSIPHVVKYKGGTGQVAQVTGHNREALTPLLHIKLLIAGLHGTGNSAPSIITVKRFPSSEHGNCALLTSSTSSRLFKTGQLLQSRYLEYSPYPPQYVRFVSSGP